MLRRSRKELSMAKFITVEATIVDLPAAKKGKYAGKKRHDVLTITPSDSGTSVSMDLVPEYAQTILENGKKVVMYKSNKAYPVLVEALGLNKPAKVEEAVQMSVEDAMLEAEQRNEAMSRAAAIRKSNLSKENKQFMLSLIGA
jgi:hypothetical protein